MNEIKHWRRAREVLQSCRVLLSRAIKIACFDRHCVDMIWEQWRMIEQACAEMSQVSIRIAYRCYPLVDLNDVHALPGDLLVGQCAQHQPRRVAATDRHDEAPPRRNRCTRVDGDDRRRLAGDQIVIRMDFDLHVMTSGWDTPNGHCRWKPSIGLALRVPGCFMLALSALISPNVRRIRSAWPTAACRQKSLRRAS